MKKEEIIKEAKKELNDIYNFMSADENQSFNFTMAQAEDRAKWLEKLIDKLNPKNL